LTQVINFLLLVGGLGFVARKPLAEFFRQRSRAISSALGEGRAALEASQARLNEVEAKLQRLGQELADFKTSATREMEAERERLKRTTAEESEKIMASARAQLEIATRAAKLDLKTYASEQATSLAAEMIRQRLDDAGRSRLFARFLEGLRRPSA